MTKTITCAADLIDHPEFQSLCRHWQDDLRCPLVFPDWLRDQGLWKQAEVAEWAVKRKDKQIYHKIDHHLGGPSPECNYSNKWRWQTYSAKNIRGDYASDLIVPLTVPAELSMTSYDTFAEAIAALLDHYTPS